MCLMIRWERGENKPLIYEGAERLNTMEGKADRALQYHKWIKIMIMMTMKMMIMHRHKSALVTYNRQTVPC